VSDHAQDALERAGRKRWQGAGALLAHHVRLAAVQVARQSRAGAGVRHQRR
jgi:hypothetical protein